MKKLNDRVIESAYGSDISSKPSFSMTKETFSIEESSTISENFKWQWLKQKIRDYILEASFFLILIALLINLYQTQCTAATLQDQIDSLQRQVLGKNFPNLEHDDKKSIENDIEEIEGILEKVFKEIKNKAALEAENAHSLDVSINPVVLRPVCSTSKTQVALANASQKKFNAANYIIGAEVDISRSSSSSLNPFFGFDQSNLVLGDRPEPPVDRAWCSYDKEPVLTVNLAKYVKLIAVSYQHSKWNKVIPNDAPLIYDVFACLDYFCKEVEPLVSRCEYNSYGFWKEKQEQICNISSDSSSKKIGKIQFRFRKNHGNKEKTCVNLVRVYSKTEEIPEIKKDFVEKWGTCSELTYDYHNNPKTYSLIDKKDCGILYAKGCCSECPECCNDCWIKDVNNDVLFVWIMITFMVLIISPILALLMFLLYDKCRKS